MSVIDRVEQHLEYCERYERTTLDSDYRPGEQDEEDQLVDRYWSSMTDYAIIDVQSEQGSHMGFIRVTDGVVCLDTPSDYRYAYFIDTDQPVLSVVEAIVDDIGSDRVELVCGRGRVAQQTADLFVDDDDEDDGE